MIEKKMVLEVEGMNFNIKVLYNEKENEYYCPHCGEKLELEVFSGTKYQGSIEDGSLDVHTEEVDTTVECRECGEDVTDWRG